MATKTVHTTAYRILADTSDFEKGAALTRQELRLQQRTLRDLESPLDKYEKKQVELAKLVKKGAISIDDMNDALDAQARKLGISTNKANKFEKVMGGMKSAASSLKTGLLVAGGAVTALVGGVTLIAGKIHELNQEVKDFERFGLGVNSLGTFRVLARQAGLEVEELVDLTKDLTIRIGEANMDGEGEIFDIFKKLGLNVKELQGLKPEQQLARFADAISKVENETDKLAMTDILLSDAGTKALDVLDKGSGALRRAAKEAKELGLNVNSVESEQLRKASANMDKLRQSWDALAQSLAVNVAPILDKMLTAFDKLMNNPGSALGSRGWGVNDVNKPTAKDIPLQMAKEQGKRWAAKIAKAQADATPELFAEVQSKAMPNGQFWGPMMSGLLGAVHQAAGVRLQQFNTPQADPLRSGVFGPGSSVTAGSAEAFRLFNRQGQELPMKQLNEQKRTADGMNEMVRMFNDFMGKFEQAAGAAQQDTSVWGTS